MRKQIWHIELEYEWNTWRMVKGVRKDTQKKNKETYVTASVGDTVKELNENKFLISRMKRLVKSTQNVDVKITGWKWREKCGMSNDVH
jgi:serine protease inhibitor ecotin|tara:strand:- start:159 stop:422 length:264 start_codon:yes stop_codon:yes gene_type:complete